MRNTLHAYTAPSAICIKTPASAIPQRFATRIVPPCDFLLALETLAETDSRYGWPNCLLRVTFFFRCQIPSPDFQQAVHHKQPAAAIFAAELFVQRPQSRRIRS